MLYSFTNREQCWLIFAKNSREHENTFNAVPRRVIAEDEKLFNYIQAGSQSRLTQTRFMPAHCSSEKRRMMRNFFKFLIYSWNLKIMLNLFFFIISFAVPPMLLVSISWLFIRERSFSMQLWVSTFSQKFRGLAFSIHPNTRKRSRWK